MPATERKRRWFHLSPDRFVVGLLLVICLLWLSERFQWFGFNHHKGWTVLIAVAAVGVTAVVMLLWWAAGLIFPWRFQFGIRSVLAFSLASSIAVSWLAVQREKAQRQANAVEWAKNLGGGVRYSWEFESGNQLRNPEPPALEWLRRMLGIDFFSAVAEIDLDGSKTDDAGLERLKDLPRLTNLFLEHTNITDGGMVAIGGLPQLEYLRLSHTRVTDVGLEKLSGLFQLQILGVCDTKITDRGLKHLAGLPHLKNLLIEDTASRTPGWNTSNNYRSSNVWPFFEPG